MRGRVAFVSVSLLALAVSTATPAMSKRSAQEPETGATPAQPSSEPDRVWVGKSDEAKSCSKGGGVALGVMATQLQGAKVKVFAKKKSHDGKMRIQMCGADKGNMNAFLISRDDLEVARGLGFSPMSASQ